MAKLLENIFRSVNIALVNELAILCRADGHRHLGGRRRRRHQALRLHALRARARDGRPLPAGRSVLPDLAGPGVPHVDRVHRARRQGQPADARTTASSGSSARSTTSPSRSRARGSRSSASATRAASATSASRPRCGSSRCSPSAARELVLPRPFVPALPELGLAELGARRATARRRRGRARHRPPGIDHWRWCERRRCSSTCAARPAGCHAGDVVRL